MVEGKVSLLDMGVAKAYALCAPLPPMAHSNPRSLHRQAFPATARFLGFA